MSVVVRCPECSKKLKVGENLVGRRVKCSCGNVFVAHEDAAVTPAPPPAADAPAEKVVVPCTECGAKLKVPGAKLGKKMKCPTCSAVFVAAAAAPPAARRPAPVAPPPPAEDDIFANILDEESPAVQAAHRMPPELEPNLLDDEEEVPVAKPRAAKAKAIVIPSDLDEDEPPLAAKPVARKAKARPPVDDDDDTPPKRKVPAKKQSKAFVNTLVLLIVFSYSAFTAAVYLDYLPLEPPASTGPLARRPNDKGGLAKKDNDVAKKDDDKKSDEPKIDPKKDPEPEKKDDVKGEKVPPPGDYAELLKERQERDMELLTELKEKAPKDVPGILAVLQPHAGVVRAIAFSPVEAKVAALTNSELKIWDLKKGAVERAIPGFKTFADQLLVYSPDGKFLATADPVGKAIKVYQADSGELAKSLPAIKTIRALSFSRDSAQFIALTRELGEPPVVKIWQVSDWAPREYSDKIDPDSRVALSSDGEWLAEVVEEKVILHSLLTAETREKNIPKLGNGGLALSFDNRILLTIDPEAKEENKNEICVVDLETGDARVVLSGEPSVLLRPEFSPDGKYVFYCATAKSATHVVDLASGRLVSTPPDFNVGRAFSAGGLLYAFGEAGVVKIRETAEFAKAAEKTEKAVKVESKNDPEEKKVEAKKDLDPKSEPDAKQAAKALNKALSATMRRSPAGGMLLGIAAGAMQYGTMPRPATIRPAPPRTQPVPPPPKEIEKKPAPEPE